MTRFELATPRPPDAYSNRTELHPDWLFGLILIILVAPRQTQASLVCIRFTQDFRKAMQRYCHFLDRANFFVIFFEKSVFWGSFRGIIAIRQLDFTQTAQILMPSLDGGRSCGTPRPYMGLKKGVPIGTPFLIGLCVVISGQPPCGRCGCRCRRAGCRSPSDPSGCSSCCRQWSRP